MLLSPIADVSENQGWTDGSQFTSSPDVPVVVKIRRGYEDAEPRSFMSGPPVISEQLYEVLIHTGVTNLDAYDAVLKSADGKVVIKGFKVFSLYGLIAAADLSRSQLAPQTISKSRDASFDKLVLKSQLLNDRLMFRLEENTSAILVYESVKLAIEKAGIPHIEFQSPEEFIS